MDSGELRVAPGTSGDLHHNSALSTHASILCAHNSVLGTHRALVNNRTVRLGGAVEHTMFTLCGCSSEYP